MAKKTNSIKLPVETAEVILKRELPGLINDITMLVRRPFRFIWDSSIDTASTDCLAEIRMSPRPFLQGEREVGYGSAYHETGHICYSPYGVDLLREAYKKGGETSQKIMNIILDRKDDYLTAKEAPGFADTLRKRLLVIRTMARRERYKYLFSKTSLSEQSQILRNFKPADVYEDFFLTAKCGKSPKFKITRKAMRHIRLQDIIEAAPEKLLWATEKVRAILDSEVKSEKVNAKKAETAFIKMWNDGEMAIGGGDKLDKATQISLQAVLKQYLGGLRVSGTSEILRKLGSMGIIHPGPISVGLTKEVPVIEVKPNPRNYSFYQAQLANVIHLVNPLVKNLQAISTPSEFELYGQEEGELDLTEVARIATNLGGYYMETVVERDIDAEIHLAIDSSGSMHGFKINEAKKIAIIFSEAIKSLEPLCLGRIWSFNSNIICDYGRPNDGSDFINAEGDASNSDTHMLKIVGTKLLQSTKKRKILFVLCDDGPDDMQLAKSITQQLTARGVIVIHMLVGVHGTPDIYPIELLYTDMDECIDEFGDLLKTIVTHIK